MNKQLAMLFAAMCCSAYSQVQLEVDAIKPRTITAEEVDGTIIDYGELVVDPSSGAVYIGDNSKGGVPVRDTNSVLRTGSEITGNIQISSNGAIYVYGYALDSMLRVLFSDRRNTGWPEIENIGRIGMGELEINQSDITYSGVTVLNMKNGTLYGGGQSAIRLGEDAVMEFYKHVFLNGNSISNAGTISATNNIHIGPDGMTNLARFTIAGNGITNKDPDHYTMTTQQRSSTAAIQGDKSAYFYAEAVNSDVEAVFGVSTLTQGVLGTISAHDFNLRCGNTNKLGVTATGINGHGQTFSNVVLASGVETDPKFTAVSNAWWEEIQKGASAGTGNLSATNSPAGAGQMLFASDNTLSNLYFADNQLIMSLAGHTGDYYVAKWGSDANAGTSWTAPKLTIQAAANLCVSNNLVLVAPGIYDNGCIVFTSSVYATIRAPVGNAFIIGSNYVYTSFTNSQTGVWAVVDSVYNYTTNIPPWKLDNLDIKGGFGNIAVYNSRVSGETNNHHMYKAHIDNTKIYDCRNLFVAGCTVLNTDIYNVHNSSQTPLFIAAGTYIGARGSIISNCSIRYCNIYTPIESFNASTYPVRVYNTRIDSCIWVGAGGAYVPFYYVYLYNCVLSNNRSTGMFFSNGGLYSGCLIYGNTMTSAFGLGSMSQCVLFGNTAPASGLFSGTILTSTEVINGNTTNILYGRREISGDLAQRSTDRHYFGTNYIGFTNSSFVVTSGLSSTGQINAGTFNIGYVPIRSDGTNYYVSPFGTNLYFQLSTNPPSY